MLPLQTVCCCYDKKNRLLEHNTYLTLPYLTHLFYRTLTRSTGIHQRFIVWFLERTIILEDKRSPPSEQISNLPEISLESITIQIQFSKYSRHALERHLLWWWLLLLSEKQRPNRTEEYIKSSRRKFTFFLRSTTCLSCTNTKINQYKTRAKKEEDKGKTTTTSTSKP